MKSRDVRVWAIKVNVLRGGARPRKSYTVRWLVAGKETSKTYATRALADNFRSDLMQAQNRGESFDTVTGLPESMVAVKEAVTWLAFAVAYLSMKWPGAAAKSRQGLIDALVTVTPVLVREPHAPVDLDTMRVALRDYLLPPNRRHLDVPASIVPAIVWLRRASLPLTDLAGAAVVRAGLDALSLKMDGKAAAATTTRRKRSVFYNVLQYAVELEVLDFNPVDKLRVRSRRKKVTEVVDRRVVANPRQALELLTALTYVGQRGKDRRGERLVGFFACMYFAALRPGEALGLREDDCCLPARCSDCGADLTTAWAPSATCEHQNVTYGWGLLTLEKNRPQSGKRWTDSGKAHDERGLKHRAEEDTRAVPAPPPLVGHLRRHIARFGVADDGRLFRSPRGNPVSASTYSRVWEEARTIALAPRQVASPLAGRPYDLRHAALSTWLNAGVPPAEAAERAGNSVDVLLAVYAACLDGDEDIVNGRIEGALGGLPWMA